MEIQTPFTPDASFSENLSPDLVPNERETASGSVTQTKYRKIEELD